MSTDESDESSDSSVNTEVHDEVMENDATTDATAPLDDATTADDDDVQLSSSPEGTATSSSETEPEYGSLPQEVKIDNSKSAGEASPAGDGADDGDDDSSAANEAEETPPATRSAAVIRVDDQEEEKLIILPNFAQTKAEAIEDDDANNNIVAATLDEQSVQESDASKERSANSINETVDDTQLEDNPSSNRMSSSSESTPSGSSDVTEEAALDKQDVPTNEQTSTSDNWGSESDASNSITANNVKREAPSTFTNEQEGGDSETQDADNPSNIEEDGGPRSSIESEATNESSHAESNDIQSIEPSAESNNSKEDQTNQNNTSNDPKDANITTNGTKGDAIGEGGDEPRQIKLVDYASKLAGAQILEQSSSLKGASQLLTGDKDKYSIAPCEDKRYVVIGLSEDILVKQIKLSNYERYSSRVREFQVLASQEYPTPNEEYWNSIGMYEAKSKSGEQMFELEEPAWARYLKFRFLSHYGSEHYCTLSQIKVHGSTMLQGFHEQWIESEKKDRELVEHQEHDTADQEGGGDFEAKPVGNEGEVHEGGNSVGQEEDKSREIMKYTAQDLRHNEDVTEENAAVEESQQTRENPDGQVKESRATSANDPEDEIEDEAVSTHDGVDERTDTKAVNDSPRDAMADSTDGLGSDEDEAAVNNEKSDGDSNESSPETCIDLGENEGAGQDLQVAESNANDDVSDEDSTPTSDELEHQGNKADVMNDPDDQNPIETDHKQSIATVDGGEPMQNDSSIAAVTGVVKAAVTDASDAIKNATSDAIKNVKDALRTTVASAKTSETEKEDNTTLNEGIPSDNSGTEGELGSKPQSSDTAKKQDKPSTKAIAQTDTTGTQQAEDGSTVMTPQDNAKQKSDAGSSKADDANVAKTDSKPEKGNTILKEDSKTTAGRDLLRRGTITLAGKDGKGDIDASSGELFAKISRRFPHASCMKDLDFQAFKSKTLLANAGSGGLVGRRGGAKMEPIFAKITNEIKSVQITHNQYEQYMSALKTCYETVFFDMAKDLDSVEASVDQRLSSLERAVFLSEMRAKGPNSPSYDGVTKLFATFPLAASAFQFTATHTMPEYSKELFAGLAIFLLLLVRCLPRRKKPDQNMLSSHMSNRGSHIEAMNDSPKTATPRHITSPSENNGRHTKKSPAIQIPELTLANELLEKENVELAKKLNETEGQLADANGKLSSLQTQQTSLQQEHASLQQRYSQLEQTVSTLDSRREIKHVILSGGSTCSTPTPSIQNEPPVSSETRTTPTRSPGRQIVDTPLKNRFRKKKIWRKINNK